MDAYRDEFEHGVSFTDIPGGARFATALHSGSFQFDGKYDPHSIEFAARHFYIFDKARRRRHERQNLTERRVIFEDVGFHIETPRRHAVFMHGDGKLFVEDSGLPDSPSSPILPAWARYSIAWLKTAFRIIIGRDA